MIAVTNNSIDGSTMAIRWIAVSIVAEYMSTIAHHVYGAIVYGTPERLIIAAIFTGAFAVTALLLILYRRRASQFQLGVLGLVVGFVWVGALGLFEGGYNHAYKDMLFVAGLPPDTVIRFHPV